MTFKTKKTLTIAGVAALMSTSAIVPAQAVISELVVTAQKREQNIQDIPLAVSAFDSAFLDNTGYQNIFDIIDYVPGFAYTQSQTSGQTSFIIRGIGTSGNNAGLEPSVGVFVDGVYRSRSGAAIYDMVDLERIEVLRGPQGTLFGKNTSSGAVNIVSQKPQYEFGGSAELTIGNLDAVNVKGLITGPIVEDKLAASLSGFSSKRDGFVDNLTDGQDLNDVDRWGIKGQALFEPTDTLSFRLIADYTESDENCCAGITWANGPTDAAVGGMSGTVLTPSAFDDNVVAVNDLPTSKVEDYGVSLQMDWDLGNHTLTTISGWRNYKFDSTIDADFTDLNLVPLNSRSWDQSAFSQEIRIQNNDPDRFEYVLGAYYFQQDLDLDEALRFGSDTNLYVDLINIVDEIVSEELTNTVGVILSGDPDNPVPISAVITDPFLFLADGLPDGGGSNESYKQDHESWAIFGQGTYNFTDRLSGTLGLRYTSEDKKLDAAFTNTPVGGVIIPPGTLPITTTPDISGIPFGITHVPVPLNLYTAFQPVTPAVGAGFTTNYSDEAITGTAKLQFEVTPDVLTYFSYSHGYKSGGTNVTRVLTLDQRDFDPETADSYEIGMKGTFFDNNLRLNAAAYFVEYDDFQDNTFLGTQFILQNAGKVEAKGVEIEALATPSEALTLEGQVTWQDAEFVSFESGPCSSAAGVVADGVLAGSCDLSGGVLPNTPEWTIQAAATYEMPIANTWTGFARAEAIWRDDQLTATTQDPRSWVDGYATVGARLGVRSDDDRWELIAWGKNLTDEHHTNLTFDGVLQSGKLYGYPIEPRTYGVTVRSRF